MPLTHKGFLRSADTLCFPKLTVPPSPPVPRALLRGPCPLPTGDDYHFLAGVVFPHGLGDDPTTALTKPAQYDIHSGSSLDRAVTHPKASHSCFLECLSLGCSLWKHLCYEKPGHREWAPWQLRPRAEQPGHRQSPRQRRECPVLDTQQNGAFGWLQPSNPWKPQD